LKSLFEIRIPISDFKPGNTGELIGIMGDEDSFIGKGHGPYKKVIRAYGCPYALEIRNF
jgi:hypothetical protein